MVVGTASGTDTVTAALPVTVSPCIVAVMLEVPTATPVTRPVALTVATPGTLEVRSYQAKLTFFRLPPVGSAGVTKVTVLGCQPIWEVPPTFRAMAGRLAVAPVGAATSVTG